MKAIIINVGDELLNGHTVNTNASYLSLKLHLLGIDVIENIVIKDEEKDIMKSLEYSTQNSSLTIITGGLGPTSDDVTKKAICNFYKLNLTLLIMKY